MTATLWWRDDDAGRDDPKLERLLALADACERPVALAVVPQWLEPATVERILASPWATVLQHGIDHADHGVGEDKMIELGGGVDRAWLEDALQAGRERLAAAFGERFLPVMVPPWNRIAPDLVPRLPALGFTGLSCFAEPPGDVPLRRIDTHVDIVAWREDGRMRPVDTLETALHQALDAMPGTPIGLLTHHLVAQPEDWDGLDRLLRLRHGNEQAAWTTATDLFGEP